MKIREIKYIYKKKPPKKGINKKKGFIYLFIFLLRKWTRHKKRTPQKKQNRTSDKEHMYQTKKQKGEGWKRNRMLKQRNGWRHQHVDEYKRRAKKQHFDKQEKIYWNGDNLSMY